MEEIDYIIIGAGITGLSVAMPLYNANKSFMILEKNDYIGGQIRTKEKNGFIFETGPNTGTLSKSEVIDLFNFTDNLCELEIADRRANNRWIWKKDKFHSLPNNPINGIFTPLFTIKDKFRILAEPFRKKGENPNESIGALAERRLGKSFVDYAVDPFIGGVYAANPYSLITKYALPKLYNLEQNYGSFVMGAIKKAQEPKTENEKKQTKEVFSAINGLSQLTNSLGKIYNDRIRLNIRDIKVNKSNEKWIVTYRENNTTKKLLCKAVISTVAAYELDSIFEDIVNLEPITNINYSPVIEVIVGFNHLKNINLNAFGGLVPSVENKEILGILFPSTCFKNRVPYSDSGLFNIFMGGTRNGEKLLQLTDEEIKETALRSLIQMMKLPNDICPNLFEISKYEKAIPLYDNKIEACLNHIKKIENENKGLILAGSICGGIGLANRISQGINIGNSLIGQAQSKNKA